MNKDSKKIFFNADLCKSNVPTIRRDDHLRVICENLRSRRAFQRYLSKAFTLLEVIISLVIFVIGVLAVFYLFPIGLKASKKLELVSKVSILAQKKLEDTKVAGFQAIDPLSPGIPLEGTEGNLRWRLSLRDVTAVGTLEGSLREISVTIFWTEEGKERSRSFLTHVAD